jgi:adenosylhomocysteine nucleosidase
MNSDLVVVLTAINVEYQAVLERLTDVRRHSHDRGTFFEVGVVRGTGCRIAVGLTGKGNQPAGVLAERALAEFSPVALLFVGVAGGLWDTTKIGDVVVATHVYAYHGGTSEDDGLKSRPRVWETAHGIGQLAAHVGRTGAWAAHRESTAASPRVHYGAVAAGEVVQNSAISAQARWIRDHYNDALAIEMESAGVAQAGHLHGTPVGVVRGISDRADGTKGSTSDATSQPEAAANAAAFALCLAQELINDEGRAAVKNRDDNGHRGAVYNSSSGQVGIQAGGNVTGSSVLMGASQPRPEIVDLAAEVASLREAVSREHHRGAVDRETYEAAQAELTIADEAVATGTPEGRSAFVLALKRLRGLIADVAELAAKIAVVITAAGKLS